nr:glycosyltransferase [Saprospiraceae bacterium]
MIIYLISSAAVVLSVAYFILIQWLLTQWDRLSPPEVSKAFIPSTKVSIIVPARNEAANIGACLDSLVQQSYPASLQEIIVIDDHSTDVTAAIVRSYEDRGVRLLSLAEHLNEPTQSYKKAAIALGVSVAQGGLILTTDADCIAPTEWVTIMVQNQQAKNWQCIAGPVLFHQEQNALERFQSLDFIGTMIITGAGLSSGQLLLANGANFAYTKRAFEQVDGFTGVNSKASGDDVFLLHKIAAAFPGQVGFLKHAQACIQTKAMPDLGSFVQQRLRWGTKNASYSDARVTMIAGLVFTTCWGILLCSLLSLTGSLHALLAFVLALGIKASADYLLLRKGMLFFGRMDLRPALGWSQVGHILYIALVGMGSLL